VQFLKTDRIGQISGSSVDDDSTHHDPQGWPLLNYTNLWGALGFDEGANTEHEGRLYFFSGDVLCKDFLKNPFNNSHLVAWTDDQAVLRHGGHLAAGWHFILPSLETGGGQGQPDWRLCGNCGGLFWDGDPNFKGVCVNGRGQPNWRFCGKCGGLFWNGDPNFKGVCPKGDVHSAPALSWNFILPSVETGGGRHSPIGWHFILPSEETGGGQGQTKWRFCGKCGGLFWNGDPNFKGVCPKGGIHSALGWNFILPSVETGGGQGQPGWSFCGSCGGLFWDGDSTKGVCPGAQGGGFRLQAVLKDGSFWPFEADAPIGVTLSDEPASDAFSYGGRVYVFVGAATAHWSGQTRPGDPTYGLYLVSSDRPDQPAPYRKEFLFNPRIGVCPADGGSHDVLGYNFVLQHDIAGGGLRESNWFSCRKCATLFQGENGQLGVCPAGGGHEANTRMVVSYGGGEDSLNQGQWRRCGKCQGMFWAGYFPDSGICPADQMRCPDGPLEQRRASGGTAQLMGKSACLEERRRSVSFDAIQAGAARTS
jgi:hypothetical protein